MLGIKQAKYSHYENQRREPSLDELCRIARALHTTPNVLLGFEPLRVSAPPREIITGNSIANVTITGDNNKISQTINQPKKKAKK